MISSWHARQLPLHLSGTLSCKAAIYGHAERSKARDSANLGNTFVYLGENVKAEELQPRPVSTTLAAKTAEAQGQATSKVLTGTY